MWFEFVFCVPCRNAELKLRGVELSPVLHLCLRNSTGDRDSDSSKLQAIVDAVSKITLDVYDLFLYIKSLKTRLPILTDLLGFQPGYSLSFLVGHFFHII